MFYLCLSKRNYIHNDIILCIDPKSIDMSRVLHDTRMFMYTYMHIMREVHSLAAASSLISYRKVFEYAHTDVCKHLYTICINRRESY